MGGIWTPGASSAPLTAPRCPPPLEPELLLTAPFCGFRGRREAPGLVRAPRRLCACDGASRVNSGLVGCPGGAGILVLFSVAEGFGLFYSPFQLWPIVFFLANTGVGGKGIKAGFSLLSCFLPAPEAFFHNPKFVNKSQVLVRWQWVCLVPPVQPHIPRDACTNESLRWSSIHLMSSAASCGNAKVQPSRVDLLPLLPWPFGDDPVPGHPAL